MAFLNRLFFSVYLSIVYASVVCAYQRSAHSVQNMDRRATKFDVFQPDTKFETFGDGLEQPPAFSSASLSDSTISFVVSHLGLDKSQVAFQSGFAGNSAKFAYARQAHDGVPFANAVANLAWKDSKVISFGSSFVKSDNIAPSNPTVTVDSVIPNAEKLLEGKYNNHPATLEYLVRPDGSVALTHVIQIQNEDAGTWYEAFMDAHSGELLTATNFVSDAGYKVLPIIKETLPEGLEFLTDPQDLFSSPRGWHSNTTTAINGTAGNNVISFKDNSSSYTKPNGPNLIFNYTYDATVSPTEGQNLDASRTNAFYIINSVHDFTYRYGFTETAFNFQFDNFGKGGEGNDGVLMSVQDASGLNNANFATPPDGQSGICRMYIFDETPIERDGAMENDIVVHEMTHGVSNRLTGGGTARCLQTLESAGMGEGWSDAMAEWTEQKSAQINDYVLGQYVVNDPAGIRHYPYSTNPQVNPLRYSNLATLDEVHDIGEVWANMLHNVYAALVEAHGFSSNAKVNPFGLEGNVVFLNLFLHGLSMQVCNPTFVDARDAFIAADFLYGYQHACLLWKVFASRGLGSNAQKGVYQDDSTVPAVCF